MATRDAFGEALAAIGGARADVVVLDGEVSDSTRTQNFADAHPAASSSSTSPSSR